MPSEDAAKAHQPQLEISPSLSKYATPPATYLQLKPQINHILASTIIFHPLPFSSSSSSSSPTSQPPLRILLIRRHPDDYFPLFWETPGGGVDLTTDASLIAAASRELFEETGLTAVRALQVLGVRPEQAASSEYGVDLSKGEEYEVEDGGEVWMFGDASKGDRWGKITFLMEIEEEEEDGVERVEGEEERAKRGGDVMVRIREEEHVDWRWVTEEEVREGRFEDGREMEVVGEAVRLMLLEGFRVKKEMLLKEAS